MRIPNKKRATKNLGEMISRILIDGFVLERKVAIGPGCGIIYLPFVLIGKTIRVCILPIKERFLDKDTLNISSKKDLEETVSEMILNGLVYEKKVSKANDCAKIYVPKEWQGNFVRVIIIPVHETDSLAKDRKIAELRIKISKFQKHLTRAKKEESKLEIEKVEEPIKEISKDQMEEEDAY